MGLAAKEGQDSPQDTVHAASGVKETQVSSWSRGTIYKLPQTILQSLDPPLIPLSQKHSLRVQTPSTLQGRWSILSKTF